jgi:formylglycine-generating enzyme required for sulfatase activity
VSGPCGFASTGAEVAGTHLDGASPEGVQDMAGNVAEWTTGPAGEASARGGSFLSALATDLRTWQKRALPPSTRSPDVGVRCVYAAREELEAP